MEIRYVDERDQEERYVTFSKNRRGHVGKQMYFDLSASGAFPSEHLATLGIEDAERKPLTLRQRQRPCECVHCWLQLDGEFPRLPPGRARLVLALLRSTRFCCKALLKHQISRPRLRGEAGPRAADAELPHAGARRGAGRADRAA